MKSYRNKVIAFSALWAVMLIAEGVLIFNLIRRQLLPTRYLALIVVLLLLLWGITGAFLYYHGKRKHKTRRTVFNVFGCALAVLGIIGSIFATGALRQVHQVIDEVTDIEKKTVAMTVYVRSNDKARTLADAAGYTFLVPTAFDNKNTQAALDALAKELGIEVKVVRGGTLNEIVDLLLSGGADALLVNQTHFEMLTDHEEYEDVYSKIRLLYETAVEDHDEATVLPEVMINIVAKDDPGDIVGPDDPDDPGEIPDESGNVPSEDPPAPAMENLGAKDVTKDPFLLYVAGSDTRTQSLPSKTRNDVNLLLAVNPKTKTIQVVTTPRDSYVPDPKHSYKRDKLTHCGNGGIENSIKVLESLYGLHIDYYCHINFTGVVTVVDAIGGITVYSNTAYDREGMHIVKGNNTLNGTQALLFARERYLLPNGDFDRGRNHIRILTAVFNKVSSAKTLLRSYSSILSSISTMFRTSLSSSEIESLVRMQLDDMSQWKIESYAVDATGGWNYTATSPNAKRWVCYPKANSIKEAKNLLKKVLQLN